MSAIIVAGVAGTAITADLGARKIREELDALQVLGVDPIKNLVVPRFLALMLITGLLDVYAILFGISGGLFAELLYGQPLGGFFATLFNNASVDRPLGVAAQVHRFRRDRRGRLLLQGDERVRRRRRGSGAPSTRRSSSRCWRCSRSTTCSPRRCSRPIPRSR